jgi:hypothetical protein
MGCARSALSYSCDLLIDLSSPSSSLSRSIDGLTLAAFWELTHGRLDLYHQIVTGQANLGETLEVPRSRWLPGSFC